MNVAGHSAADSGGTPAAGSASKRILIVDDNDLVRALIRDMLGDAGYEVAEAEDGTQALRALRAAEYDIIVTDLVMPDCDGIELLRKVRRNHPKIRVIAVSGAPSADVYLKAASALGAGEVLPKPIDQERLLAAVKGLLAS